MKKELLLYTIFLTAIISTVAMAQPIPFLEPTIGVYPSPPPLKAYKECQEKYDKCIKRVREVTIKCVEETCDKICIELQESSTKKCKVDKNKCLLGL